MKKQYIAPFTNTVTVKLVSLIAESVPVAGPDDGRDPEAGQLVREDEGFFGTQSW